MKVEAPTLSAWRAHGIIFADVECNDKQCRHRGKLEVDAVPDHLTVFDLRKMLRCSQCGGSAGQGVSIFPRWPDRMGQRQRAEERGPVV